MPKEGAMLGYRGEATMAALARCKQPATTTMVAAEAGQGWAATLVCLGRLSEYGICELAQRKSAQRPRGEGPWRRL